MKHGCQLARLSLPLAQSLFPSDTLRSSHHTLKNHEGATMERIMERKLVAHWEPKRGPVSALSSVIASLGKDVI